MPSHIHLSPQPRASGPFACSRELEAILRIYIEMFRLIEPELKAALVKDSAERAA